MTNPSDDCLRCQMLTQAIKRADAAGAHADATDLRTKLRLHYAQRHPSQKLPPAAAN